MRGRGELRINAGSQELLMSRVEQSCHWRKARMDEVQGAVKGGRADRVLALIAAEH